MCFSAPVSYSTSILLISTGVYAVQQSRQLKPPYWLWALIPIFFGLQQGAEGRVWQMLEAGQHNAAVIYAIGFHFFSHFLWLWWLPMCSYYVEPNIMRKRIFGGITLFGALAGSLVYLTILTNPDWMTPAVRGHSIIYSFIVPNSGILPLLPSINFPFTPLMLYGLIIIVPLLFSSQKQIKIFGGLIILSLLFASETYNEAFVSVWCFFAALLSLYLVYMTRVLTIESKKSHSV